MKLFKFILIIKEQKCYLNDVVRYYIINKEIFKKEEFIMPLLRKRVPADAQKREWRTGEGLWTRTFRRIGEMIRKKKASGTVKVDGKKKASGTTKVRLNEEIRISKKLGDGSTVIVRPTEIMEINDYERKLLCELIIRKEGEPEKRIAHALIGLNEAKVFVFADSQKNRYNLGVGFVSIENRATEKQKLELEIGEPVLRRLTT